MKKYDHDATEIPTACGVSIDTLNGLRRTVIRDFLENNSKVSVIVEKLEAIILKDVENYLRPFLIDYITLHKASEILFKDKMTSGLKSLIKKMKECDGDCDNCDSCNEE